MSKLKYAIINGVLASISAGVTALLIILMIASRGGNKFDLVLCTAGSAFVSGTIFWLLIPQNMSRAIRIVLVGFLTAATSHFLMLIPSIQMTHLQTEILSVLEVGTYSLLYLGVLTIPVAIITAFVTDTIHLRRLT